MKDMDAMDTDESLHEVACTFDLRSLHIGDNVALWLLREAYAVYGDSLTVEERSLIDVLIWNLKRNGASTDNISYGSVIEIMRYETNMASVFQKLQKGKHIPHRKLLAMKDATKSSLIARTSLGELAVVADDMFTIACESGADELLKLSNGDIPSRVYSQDDGYNDVYKMRNVSCVWKAYIQLLSR
jgi:hypothetical protein